MTLAQSKRASELQKDMNAWEENRLMTSGEAVDGGGQARLRAEWGQGMVTRRLVQVLLCCHGVLCCVACPPSCLLPAASFLPPFLSSS